MQIAMVVALIVFPEMVTFTQDKKLEVDLDTIESQPVYNVISQLIYAASRHQVSDVWIGGERKLRERRLIDIDTAEILAKARRWQARIAST